MLSFMKFFLKNLFLILLLKVTPLFAQDLSGYQPFQQTSFGGVRLVSCTTAPRSRQPTYFALEATIQKGWEMRGSPKLHLQLQPMNPVQLVEPFQQPYSNLFFYPITSLIPPTDESVMLRAEGTWTACQNNQCHEEPLNLQLTLLPGLPFITPICTGISHALANTPVPMYMKWLKVWAVPINEDELQLTIDLPDPPKELIFYDEHKNKLDILFHVKGTRLTFNYPKPTDSIVRLYLKTHQHFYEVSAPLSTNQPPPPEHSIFLFFKMVFLFCLLSPWFIFWGRTTDKLKNFKNQTKQSLLFLPAISVILLYFTWTEQNALVFQMLLPSKMATLLLMIGGLFFIPMHPFIPAILTFLTPTSYLMELEDFSLLFQMLFWGLAFTFFTILFAGQLLYSKKIFHILNSNKYAPKLWWCVRLPYIALICYYAFNG